MDYTDHYKRFIENDTEDVIQFVPNSECIDFLNEHAPRLYCPDRVIEETFAFRTFTMRKHIMKTEAGFLLSEFLVTQKLPWAGKYNTINAPLTHHLNEFRWLGFSDSLLDYIDFFIKGEGSDYSCGTAFDYHTPALFAMYEYCIVTGNEDYLRDNAEHFEKYFLGFEKRHFTESGLFWSTDDREGTEYSISGTTVDMKPTKGFRVLMNSCMYGDAIALSKIFDFTNNYEKRDLYAKKAEGIKKKIDSILWDGDFYRSLHPTDELLCGKLDFERVSREQYARELTGYIPWCFGIPDKGKEGAFKLLNDDRVFLGKTGFTTADISHKRFMYYHERSCTWNGKVWPYATSYALNAVISLLNSYEQTVISDKDLYSFIKTYSEMHYSMENGRYINFIDEVMLPFEHVWDGREKARRGEYKPTGGINRGKDYNHSTYIDLVIRGLCGIDPLKKELTVKPRIKGLWSWFKLENLHFKKKRYDIYYDEDGTVFRKGVGIIIVEKKNKI